MSSSVITLSGEYKVGREYILAAVSSSVATDCSCIKNQFQLEQSWSRKFVERVWSKYSRRDSFDVRDLGAAESGMEGAPVRRVLTKMLPSCRERIYFVSLSRLHVIT